MEDTYIAIDFDGTCVIHAFPEIGEDVPNCVEVLKMFQSLGYKLILNTMRSDGRSELDKNGNKQNENVLSDAVNWFKIRGIELYGINRNPTQDSWTSSPKVYAHYYIDDAAVGCPLLSNGKDRPFVDWVEIKNLMIGK